MKQNRKITDDDKKAAASLAKIWDAHKKEHPDFTQEMIAAEFGMTQGAFWQYKEGRMTFGLEMVIKMAIFFKVDVSAIKKFESLDRLLSNQSHTYLDEHVSAVIGMIESVPLEDRCIIRGKVQVLVELALERNKILFIDRRKSPPLDRRNLF